MKTFLSLIPLLAAASSLGATLPGGLTAATAGRLTDYNNWFGPQFRVASDDDFAGIPLPSIGQPTPTAMTDVNRVWSGWAANWSPGLAPVLTGTPSLNLEIEFVFLGETGEWWDDIGYRYNGVDFLLADGVQAVGGLTRVFGDYAIFTLDEGDTLDFFVTGSQVYEQDGVLTVGSTQGGKYFVFDKALNTPPAATHQSYFGNITPLTSVRGPQLLGDETGTIPFTVVAFDERSGASEGSGQDYTDLILAFRAGTLVPCCGSVPEPAGFGVFAVAALAGLVLWRKRSGS